MSNRLLTEEELVEKCMPTLERFEEVEKQVFYPIPKPVEFSVTIRIYASTMSREAVRKTLEIVRAEVLEQISKMPVFIYSKVLNTTVPIRDAPEWQALKKGEK